MDDLARLTELEALRRLKAKYFRSIDTKDWEGLRSVFTSDCAWDFSQAGGADVVLTGTTKTGPDEIVAFVQAAIQGAVTVHHGHMPELELISDTTASGIWSMFDRLWYPQGAPVREIEGYGHYRETYEKVDGEWLISSVKLTRLRIMEAGW